MLCPYMCQYIEKSCIEPHTNIYLLILVSKLDIIQNPQFSNAITRIPNISTMSNQYWIDSGNLKPEYHNP